MSSELSPEQLQSGLLTTTTYLMGRKRQQPLLTLPAHIFHINPETKKTWIPVTESAVPVSFFYDSTRALYRIISVDGTKAVVNSSLRPGMTFTKTSGKFGQWADPKLNAVYGLGFHTESDLDKFQEQFDEIKEAIHLSILSPARLHQPQGTPRGVLGVGARSGPSTIISVSNKSEGEVSSTTTMNNGLPDFNANSIYQYRRALPHISGNGLQGSPAKIKIDSPKRLPISFGGLELIDEGRNTPETIHLKHENEKLRHALHQSSANSKLWEVELSTLKLNNTRLTSTLQDCAANVEEWKVQLESYRRENARLKQHIVECENQQSSTTSLENTTAIANVKQDALSLLEQFQTLKKTSELLHKKLEDKEEELLKLKVELEDKDIPSVPLDPTSVTRNLQIHEERHQVLVEINSRLSTKLNEIGNIQQKMTDVLQSKVKSADPIDTTQQQPSKPQLQSSVTTT